MEKSVHILSEREVFVREFIALYKDHPVLWQPKHPHYRSKAERSEAYTVLVKKCQEYYPEADEDFVKMKIDSMRCSFRKERKKVLSSRETANDLKDLYKPTLWYYNLLLFIVGEEADSENDTDKMEKDVASISSNLQNGNLVKIPFWNRKHTALLIHFYKTFPCLYSTSHVDYKNKRKRMQAVKNITENLMAVTGKQFHVDDVRKKIALIRGQFLLEYKKIKKSKNQYTSTLWCFESLSFLNEEYEKRKTFKDMDVDLPQKNGSDSSSEDSYEDLDIKKESESYFPLDGVHLDIKESIMKETDDIFDTIAKNVAHKLRDMTEEQRNIAEKIVKDVMYHGQMENLNVKSRLSLDGN